MVKYQIQDRLCPYRGIIGMRKTGSNTVVTVLLLFRFFTSAGFTSVGSLCHSDPQSLLPQGSKQSFL